QLPPKGGSSLLLPAPCLGDHSLRPAWAILTCALLGRSFPAPCLGDHSRALLGRSFLRPAWAVPSTPCLRRPSRAAPCFDMTRRLDPAASRRAILDAAGGCFSATGYAGTSMHDIAKAAGVTQSLIHHHFGPKDALWAEVRRHAF